MKKVILLLFLIFLYKITKEQTLSITVVYVSPINSKDTFKEIIIYKDNKLIRDTIKNTIKEVIPPLIEASYTKPILTIRSVAIIEKEILKITSDRFKEKTFRKSRDSIINNINVSQEKVKSTNKEIIVIGVVTLLLLLSFTFSIFLKHRK